MSRITRRRAALSIIVAMMLVATACGGTSSGSADEQPPPPRPGGHLTIGTSLVWNLIDPLRSFGDTELTISNAIYDQLLTVSQDGEVEPSLVESYEISEDRLSYTLHLRQGVVFHDGTPFTSEAVKLNLERVADPANGCFCASRFTSIESIETPDDSTVVIHMSEPDAAFLSSALSGPQAGMVSPAALEEYGNDVGQHPVGTGPFRYVGQTPGAEFNVEKWDRYWKPDRPYLDGITFRAMTDAQTRFSSLQSGSIQVAENLQPLHVRQAENDDRVRVETTEGLGTTFVQFNVTRPPFDEVTARRAVCAATDSEGINQAINFGLSDTAVDSVFPPVHPYYPGPDLAGAVDHNPEQARQVVSELGGLDFTLSVGQSGTRVAQALQEQWRSVGMGVQVETLEITSLARKSTSQQYDAMLITMFGAVDPDVVPHALFGTDSPGNVTGFSDPEVDRLLADGKQTSNPEQRQAIYRQMNERLAELTPHCYLWATNYHLGTTPDTHGVVQGRNGVMTLTDAYRAE